jgi:transcriptional regulator with XRE-family HTH domain
MSSKNLSDKDSLADRLKKLRLAKGLTQARVAELAKISLGYVGHLETGRVTNPSPLVIDKLAEVLGIRSELLGGHATESTAKIPADEQPSALETLALSAPRVVHLLELIHADAALDPFTNLPPGYRERFRERMTEAEEKLDAYAAELMRSLEEFKSLLLAEGRGPKNKR